MRIAIHVGVHDVVRIVSPFYKNDIVATPLPPQTAQTSVFLRLNITLRAQLFLNADASLGHTTDSA